MTTAVPTAPTLPRLDAPTGILGRMRVVLDDLLSQEPWMLTLRLTLLMLIFHGSGGWMLSIPIKVLCGLMLVSPRMMTSIAPWVAIAIVAILVNATRWYTIDNHKYLITYWCVVAALAVGTSNPGRVLSHNARWLIGLVFAFAVAWKFIAGQFLDGSFLHFTYLQDPRLEVPTRLAAGFAGDTLPANYRLAGLLRAYPWQDASVTLSTSDTLRTIALITSYWTLLIEGAVAVAFLVPLRSLLGRWRDALLMVFVATTYFLLPVLGFAFMLILMGYAQCERERWGTRAAYLLLLVFIQLAATPWGAFVTMYELG